MHSLQEKHIGHANTVNKMDLNVQSLAAYGKFYATP